MILEANEATETKTQRDCRHSTIEEKHNEENNRNKSKIYRLAATAQVLGIFSVHFYHKLYFSTSILCFHVGFKNKSKHQNQGNQT